MDLSKDLWKQLTQLPYLSLYVDVVNSALQMDVFSKLTKKTTAEELAAAQGWHEGNTRYFLDALYSIGYIEKDGSLYVNTPDAQKYLTAGSPDEIRGFLLFYGMNDQFKSMDIIKSVQDGPIAQEQKQQSLAFEQYAGMLRQAQGGYRRGEILNIVRALPENGKIHKILDLGCATGLLGLAVTGDQEDRTGVLYDMPPMKALIQESIQMAGLEKRAEAMTGNFMSDDIGSGYDLILAVGVLGFAKADMDGLMKKLYQSLNPGGVLISFSEGIHRDFSGPWDMILGWLPYYMQGMDMGILENEVSDSALRCGFASAEKHSGLYSSGSMELDIIRKA